MLVTLDFGTTVDMLNKGEVGDALDEHEERRLRALLTGVKPVEEFMSLTKLGGSAVTSFSFPGPAQGFTWAVMNVGFELAAAGLVRLYKGRYDGAVDGGNRVFGTTPNLIVTGTSFSKGQVTIRAGEVLTAVCPTASNILSGFMTAIEIPAERIGELLL